MAVSGRFFLILMAIISILILLIVAFFILFILKLVQHLNQRVVDHNPQKPLPLLPQHCVFCILLLCLLRLCITADNNSHPQNAEWIHRERFNHPPKTE